MCGLLSPSALCSEAWGDHGPHYCSYTGFDNLPPKGARTSGAPNKSWGGLLPEISMRCRGASGLSGRVSSVCLDLLLVGCVLKDAQLALGK